MRSVQWQAIIGGSLLVLVLAIGPSETQAEWYVGGYGGLSTSGSIKDVTMPLLGQRLAEEEFPQANHPLDVNGRGTLTQTFKTSDVLLKSSAILGGKVGYFFSQEKLPWLGIELEAFSSNPAIKTQTLNTTHDITYQPNTPASSAQCLPPVPLPNCPAYTLNKSTLAVQESSLRVTTLAFNVLARYPGRFLQPYAGIGVGVFYFQSSAPMEGRQFVPGLNTQVGLKLLATEEWGLFVEGKYNLANVNTLDPMFGLSGMYSIFHIVAGVSYHF